MRNAQPDGTNKSLMNPPCFLMLQFMSASHRFSLAARGNLIYQGMYPLCWSKPIDLSLHSVVVRRRSSVPVAPTCAYLICDRLISDSTGSPQAARLRRPLASPAATRRQMSVECRLRLQRPRLRLLVLVTLLRSSSFLLYPLSRAPEHYTRLSPASRRLLTLPYSR